MKRKEFDNNIRSNPSRKKIQTKKNRLHERAVNGRNFQEIGGGEGVMFKM